MGALPPLLIMSIKKDYNFKTNTAIVTFTIPESISVDYSACSVVGDFNNWNPEIHKMHRLNSFESFVIKIELPANKTFQFKYLFNDNKWFIEGDSDGLIPNVHGTENSILSL